MQITEKQRAHHYATTRALLSEYFPRADRHVIEEWVRALRAFDLFPRPEVLDRLVAAHHLIAASIPTIDLEP
jgi:hypothetical protein